MHKNRILEKLQLLCFWFALSLALSVCLKKPFGITPTGLVFLVPMMTDELVGYPVSGTCLAENLMDRFFEGQISN